MRHLMIQWGLWLARQGGWHETPQPEPPPSDPSDLAARLRHAEAKANMRGVELHDALDRLRALEARQAVVTPTTMQRVHELVDAQVHREASGEAKRHGVYAQLIKDFPAIPHRNIAMAIEIALSTPKEG